MRADFWLFAAARRKQRFAGSKSACFGYAPSSRFVAALLLAAFASGCDQGRELPSLSKIESLSLTDQHEQAFSEDRMKGRWTVSNFIFTSCPTVCPVMTQRAVQLHQNLSDLHDRVQFVSISVDPEVDTPEALRRYAVAQGAKHKNWFFLTGQTEKIGAIAEQSFKVAVGERVARDKGYDILHASHFILVDPSVTIRGYYSNDAEGMASLERDLRTEIER